MGIKAYNLHKAIESILIGAGIEDALFETDCILEDFCGLKIGFQAIDPEKEVTEKQYHAALKAAEQRATHYPLQYILGKWDFYGREFSVGKGVLIPRSDTEVLVDHAIGYLKSLTQDKDRPKHVNVADLCSGSGCLAITLEQEMKDCVSKVVAVEYDLEAFEYLNTNIRRHSSRVISKKFDAVSPETVNRFYDLDLIVSNPPYLTANDMAHRQEEVTYEPIIALYGGDDGLYFYRRIISLWRKTLRKGGMLAVEIGMGQEEDVRQIFEENDYDNITSTKDYSGIVRVISAIK
jgi:release factor glutamine methyltransferase